jgi:hypothetical protein
MTNDWKKPFFFQSAKKSACVRKLCRHGQSAMDDTEREDAIEIVEQDNGELSPPLLDEDMRLYTADELYQLIITRSTAKHVTARAFDAA